MKNKTEKKTIVITGGSSGIGKQLVEAFRLDGHQVFSLARRNENCPNSLDVFCDVADKKSVEKAFNHIKNLTTHIDTLINCAGYGVYGASELISSEEARRQLEVNFDGILHVSKSCLPLMTQGSKIFNISSACALFPLPFRSIYCASKSAVNSLSFGMRMELSKANIDVVSICPGDIKTNFIKNRKTFLISNERYGNDIKNAFDYVEDRNNKRMPEEKAVKIIKKICEKSKPKALYIVGNKYKFFYFCSKILPTNLFIKILNKIFNK